MDTLASTKRVNILVYVAVSVAAAVSIRRFVPEGVETDDR